MSSSILFKTMQLKFSLMNDPLFNVEESRPWKLAEKSKSYSDGFSMNQYKERNPSYLIDLDFANIKTLTYQTETFKGGLSHKPYRGNNYSEAKGGGSLFLSLMVQMDRPCTARKRVSTKNKKEWVSQSRSPFNMGPNEIYLNNWNLNQTFIFKGRSSKEYLDRFISVVKQRSPRAKIV